MSDTTKPKPPEALPLPLGHEFKPTGTWRKGCAYWTSDTSGEWECGQLEAAHKPSLPLSDLHCDDKPGNKCDSYGHDDDCPGVQDEITMMYQQGQIKEAWRVADALADRLREIEEWDTTRLPDVDGRSYSFAYGSDGVRDWFRAIARAALALHSEAKKR